MAIRQYGCLRPPEHSGWFHLRVQSGCNDELGHRFADMGQQSHPLSRISLSCLDARLAWNRSEPEPLEAGRFCDCKKNGGAVQGNSRDCATWRSVSPDLSTKWERAFCNRDGIP